MEPLSLSLRATPRTPLTPRTPKASKKHHNKYELDNIPTQKFKVSYQKVTLDIALDQNSIEGETELRILPMESSLRRIKLDCRGIQIKSIIVNERRANFTYDDFLQNQEYMNDPENPVLSNYDYSPYFDSNTENIYVNQHEMLRSKFYPIFSDQNNPTDPTSSFPEYTSELTIMIPESIKLRLQSASKYNFASPMSSARSANNTPNAINTFSNPDKLYTPLNIKINYTVKNSKNGILFNGGKHTDIPKNLWYCHTFNNDLGCSASSWVPCIDNFYEKPSWDINIIVPKTVGDIGCSKIIGTKAAEKALRKIALQQMDIDETENKNESLDEVNALDDDDDEDNEDSLEWTPLVVTVPDLVSSRESPHPMDVAKKVVNFQFFNPVCAHHLGFAVGCFEKIPIVDVKRGSDELALNPLPTSVDQSKDLFALDSQNSNKVPTMLYYLPGRKQEVINSTIFLYKALEVYSKEFSSFPFTSYSLLFVDSLPSDTCTFAGMTIASTRLLYGPKLIEPMFETTEKLSVALAEQYSGVNVLPKTINDLWCIIGIARYMSDQFLKKLFGVNYSKFTFEKRCELLTELDIGKRPLANQLLRFPINLDQDLKLIHLKAPLVLSILDRRITKTDKLFGLSRVIPKIFLQAMSNDLINFNNLSTAHFQRVCEKVAHHKLESFFQTWVHHSGVPTFRITQKFNKKRLFVEMTVRQMQRSNLNKDEADDSFQNKDFLTNERYTNFVDDANTFLIETDHFNPQAAFVGPVTIRIHETDGSPYEHIMAITDSVTKMDIQYNTKYKRRKKDKRDGTEEVEEKDTNEKESKKKDKEKDKDEEKINTLGNVLTSLEELDNWGLREDDYLTNRDGSTTEAANNEDDKDEAFEWLRFDADREWLCKYSINLTDEKFESQLKQDRDVEAQYESVKHFGNVNRATLYHAKILLRTLLDSRYFFGVRVEACYSLAKISNEENDHIGMRVLLKAYKHLYCYESKIVKGYDEFDPQKYLPKPCDFSNFTDLFVLKAIIQSLAHIRNKDGDSPIELKRIMLNILKYHDNGRNDFDDTSFYCLLIKCICDLIIISNREIKSLHLDSTTSAADLPKITDSKDEFIYDAIKEINRCLKMDEWSPSYNNQVTNVILEQKIRLVSKGLGNLSFMDLLKYTTPDYQENIRLTAFEGLLVLGGLRNSNILNYYFTTMKLEESQFMKYELNKRFVKSIGVAAFSNIPSLLDDKEFLESLSVTNNETNSNNEVGNRLIQIEDTTAAKLSIKSRMDEIGRKSIQGSISILRRDLGIGKGLQTELWNAIHSCTIPINTRRNIFDIMMVLFEPRDSFIVTTNLPNARRVLAKVTTKVLTEEKKQLIVSLKREAKFKIQLPSFKLKGADAKGKNKRSETPLPVAQSPVPALLTATETGVESTQTPVTESAVTFPVPDKESLSVMTADSGTKKQKKNHTTNKLVDVTVSGTEFLVKISVPRPSEKKKDVNSEEVPQIVKPDNVAAESQTYCSSSNIVRTDPSLPLRYVRLNLITKKVTVSTDEHFGEMKSHLVTLKLDPSKLREMSKPGSPVTYPIKVERTTDPSSAQIVGHRNVVLKESLEKMTTPIKAEVINGDAQVKTAVKPKIKFSKLSKSLSPPKGLPRPPPPPPTSSSKHLGRRSSSPVKSRSALPPPPPPPSQAKSSAKMSSWERDSSSILEGLNPVKRDSKSPSPQSAVTTSLGRSKSRSLSPENTSSKANVQPKKGPKIKLKFK